MIERATPSAVVAACKRLEDFMTVNAGRPKGDLPESIAMFAEAAGLDRRAHAALRERLEALGDGDECISWAVIGTIIGLFLADELSKTKRTLWVFEEGEEEGETFFYEITVPYDEQFADALDHRDHKAWSSLLSVLHQIVERVK